MHNVVLAMRQMLAHLEMVNSAARSFVRPNSRERPVLDGRSVQPDVPDDPGCRDADEHVEQREEEARQPPVLAIDQGERHDHGCQLVDQAQAESLGAKRKTQNSGHMSI